MSSKQMIEQIRFKTGLSIDAISKVFSCFVDVVNASNGNRVPVPGLGVFIKKRFMKRTRCVIENKEVFQYAEQLKLIFKETKYDNQKKQQNEK